MASPCNPADLPQTLLEPILIRHAVHNGFKVRFDTTLLSFTQDEETGLIVAVMRDNVSKTEYKIRTKYLFGRPTAPRAKWSSNSACQWIENQGKVLAINVLVKVDLSHLVDSRKGNLHWILQPDRDHPEFGWMGIVRMVKPWDEWMFILFPQRDVDVNIQPATEELLKRVREFVGDTTPVEILNVSKWFINEVVAETYSKGNM